MQKISAYTLMEVTVAMLLSALTITICYSAYGIVTNYFSIFEEKNALATEALLLRHTLERDAERSEYLLRTSDGFVFLQDSMNVNYVFTDTAILRRLNELHTDTFKFQTNQLKSSFEGIEIAEPDTIDQLGFKLNLKKGNVVSIQLNKHYSATALFN